MHINAIDGLLVYCNYSDNQSIYRMKTDGTGRTRICDDKTDTVTLVGEWIYSLGSIPVKQISELLERYSIGKAPLSKLLGWSPNTIAREMKHCIPDKEHTARLESLFNAQNMLDLLEKNRGRITDIAYKKARSKAIHYKIEWNKADQKKE